MSKPGFTAELNNASTAYLRANKNLSKNPVWYIKFGLVTGPLGTNSQVLPNNTQPDQFLIKQLHERDF